MSSVLSKIKNLGEHDLSASLEENVFKVDDLARYGLSGSVTTVVFDPIQNLLAVATSNGKIHLLGQKNVQVTFSLTENVPITHIRIVKSIYLVAINRDNYVTVISLDSQDMLYEYHCPGTITAVESDPSLDWLFLGLSNGQIAVYDVDRGCQAPFRIGNLQKSVLSKLRMSHVTSIALHPRDAATVLVCYTDCAVVFSIASSEIVHSLRYEIPANAPGGETDPSIINTFRNPRFLSAVWHPNGHHILTTHEDGSLVFWEAAEGNLLQARTLIDTDVNIPRRAMQNSSNEAGFVRDRIRKVTWNCTSNPEETSLLVAGGDVFQGTVRGLTMLDFGSTPNIAITSYQAMGQHYANPRRHKIFPIPENVDVVDFIMLPSSNPYYAGNHNPNFLLALLSSGELLVTSYPDGFTVADPTFLPPLLSWINPFITTLSASCVPRTEWTRMVSSIKAKDGMFRGGAPARRHLRSFQERTALCTGHKDGSVRIWDASHGEIEDSNVLEASMSNALNRHIDVGVSHISLAGSVVELAVSVETGEVVLFNFDVNRSNNVHSSMSRLSLDHESQMLKDIKDRAPSSIVEGFLPQSLITAGCGPTSALVNSNIGFVAIGYANGELIVVDKRGPAVILFASLQSIYTNLLKRRSKSGVRGSVEYATSMEFGIYVVDNDSFSSIVLSVGSSFGNVYIFKIIPGSGGGYKVVPAGVFPVAEESIIQITPINASLGISAVAEPESMAKLSQGVIIPGYLIAVTRTHVRVFRPCDTKITHRKLNFNCISAGVSYLHEVDSLVLVCITDRSEFKVLSVPGLRDMCVRKLPYNLSAEFGADSLVTRSGDLILRPSKSFGALVRIWGRGIQYDEIPSDALYDVLKVTPERPTISTIQWVRGKQYLSAEDLDKIIGGPRRPKSKKMIEQEKARHEQQRLVRQRRLERGTAEWSGGEEDAGEEQSGFQGTLDNLEKTGSQYMNSFNEMISDAKTGILKSTFKSKFF